MKKNKKTKKVIACLLMLVLVTAAVALAEYAMLSRSYEEIENFAFLRKTMDKGRFGKRRKTKKTRAWTGSKCMDSFL